MKKVLSVFLALVMLFGVCAISTSAAETATVTIITNEGSPVEQNKPVRFTVRFDNFTTVKGMDVAVSVSGATDLKLTSAHGFEITPAEGTNYTTATGEAKIRLVDLTGGKSGRLVFDVTSAPIGATVTVKGTYAESGTAFATVTEPLDPTALDVVESLTPEEITKTPDSDTSLAQPTTTNTFIPYGSVVTGESGDKQVDKKPDGTFDLENGKTYSYKEFDKPDADIGITTFGITNENTDKTQIRFGNYAEHKADHTRKYGTMIFAGDWNGLRDYYIARGYEVEKFVKAIYDDAYSRAFDENGNKSWDYVKYTFSDTGAKKEVKVYIVPQKEFMWKNEAGTILEYAVRVTGANPNTVYTGIGYYTEEGNQVFSEKVRSTEVTTNS